MLDGKFLFQASFPKSNCPYKLDARTDNVSLTAFQNNNYLEERLEMIRLNILLLFNIKLTIQLETENEMPE